MESGKAEEKKVVVVDGCSWLLAGCAVCCISVCFGFWFLVCFWLLAFGFRLYLLFGIWSLLHNFMSGLPLISITITIMIVIIKHLNVKHKTQLSISSYCVAFFLILFFN